MVFFKKTIFSFFWFFGVFVSWISLAAEGSNSNDLLDQAFDISINADNVAWGGMVWRDKEWVWNFLLKWWTEIDAWDIIKNWVHADVKKKDSFVVSVARFLVRFTLILAITMIIYNWIMYVVKSSKGESSKDTLKNLIYIIVGVLLALTSIVIVRLASSVGKTSLDMSQKMLAHNTQIFNS